MLPTSGSSKGQSIHINPNFKSDVLQKLKNVGTSPGPSILNLPLPSTTHINPLFMKPPKKTTTIHMNPQFLNDEILRQKNLSQSISLTITTQQESQSEISKKSVPKVTQPNKIISKSRTRIVRESHSQPKAMSSPSKQLLLLTKRKLIRAPMLTTQQSCISTHGNELLRKKERDKIFNKAYPLTGIVPILKRRPGAFVARYALRRSNSILKNNVFPIPVVGRKHKNQMDTSITSVNKKLRLININGILYKSTGNKLQRNVESTTSTKTLQTKVNSLKIVQATNSKISKPLKSPIGRTLYVRGAKYVMDPRGFKLTRVTQSTASCKSTKSTATVVPTPKMPLSSSSSHKSLPRRIDIGGVTYIASGQSKNVFVRTSTHLVLAHLNQAKQRSVHVLSRSLTKTNKPCLIFQRLGKCAALERNRCSKVHDKQRIIVCPKFLQGLCFNNDCLLSHTKTLQKMPVCRFFLQGSCVRSDCPYLHKKLKDDSEICEDFRRGFCALGEQCNKQHVFSKKKPKLNNPLESSHELSFSSNINDVAIASDAIVYRYFNGESFVLGATENMTVESESEEDSHVSAYSIDSENSEKDENEALENPNNTSKNSSTNLKRKQLGTLPAFIPLS